MRTRREILMTMHTPLNEENTFVDVVNEEYV
jgi:hypothetical protein